jgi:hypothetical protein
MFERMIAEAIRRRALLHRVQDGAMACFRVAIAKIAQGEDPDAWFATGEDLFALAESLADGESL